MRLFYSNHLELDDGAEVSIFVNGGEVGDITASELWINAVSGSYTVGIITRDGQQEVELSKGVDMDGFALADTGSEARMMYLTSDAAIIKITADGDAELDIKVIY